jgi:hypothetical protein
MRRHHIPTASYLPQAGRRSAVDAVIVAAISLLHKTPVQCIRAGRSRQTQ